MTKLKFREIKKPTYGMATQPVNGKAGIQTHIYLFTLKYERKNF